MAVVRAPPDTLVRILVDQIHTVVYPCFHAIVHGFENLERISVKPVQSIPGTEPHISLFVLQDRHNGVLTQSIFDRVVLNDVMLMTPCAACARDNDK